MSKATYSFSFGGFRRISAQAFALGFRIDWRSDVGVPLLVMIDLGFWRTTMIVIKNA